MTSGITNSQCWAILKSLAKSAGIDGTLGAEDIEKIMESADFDGDGIISYNEFTSAAEKTIDTIEDEYLQAIEDFTNGVSAEESAESSNTDTNFSDSSASAYSSGQNFSPQAPASGRQPQITQSVNPVSLTGKEDIGTLEAGRSETLAALQQKRAEQSAQNSNPAIIQANEDIAASENSYNESLTALEEKETVHSETEQAVLALKAQKEQNDAEIAQKESAVEQTKANIAEAQSALDTCNANEPQQSDFTKTEKNIFGGYTTVEDTQAYAEAHSAWEAEKAAAEEKLANEELKLTEEESALSNCKNKGTEIDSKISETIQQAEKAGEEISEELKAVAENLDAKNVAEQNLAQIKTDVTTQTEMDISQLQANLTEYQSAIDEKNNNIPDQTSSIKENPFLDSDDEEDTNYIEIDADTINAIKSDAQILLEDGSTINVDDYIDNLLTQPVGFETQEEYQEYILDKFTSYLDEMKSTYQTQEDSNGWISNLYDGAKELLGLGTSSKDAEDSIAKYEQMVQGLTDAINGKSNMTFEQAYEYYTGTSFSTEKIDKYLETANTYSAVMVGCQYDENYIENFEKTTGKSIDDIMQGYAQCQLDTFGEVSDIKNIVDEYVQDQQTYSDKLSSIVSTTGLVCTVAGAVTTFFCPPAGIALMQAGKYVALSGMFIDNAIDLVDDITDKDGLTKDEIKDLALETGVEAVSYAAGRGIGKLTNGLNSIVSSKVAQAGANEVASYIAGQAAETVVDTGLSLTADYAIAQGQSLITTGEFMDSEDYWSLDRFLGEGKNQLIGILTGLSSAKIENYQQGVIKTAQGMILEGDTEGAKTYLKKSGMKMNDTSFEGFVKNVQDVDTQMKLQTPQVDEAETKNPYAVEDTDADTAKTVEADDGVEVTDGLAGKIGIQFFAEKTTEADSTTADVDYSKMTYDEKIDLLKNSGVGDRYIKDIETLEETQIESALKLKNAGISDAYVSYYAKNLEGAQVDNVIALKNAGINEYFIKDIARLEGMQANNALKLAQAGVDPTCIKDIATLDEAQVDNAFKLVESGINPYYIKDIATLDETQINNAIKYKNAGLDDSYILPFVTLEGAQLNNAIKLYNAGLDSSYVKDFATLEGTQIDNAIKLVKAGIDDSRIKNLATILDDTQTDSYIYFNNLTTNNGDKIFTKESNIFYMLNLDASSVEASNFEMLIDLVQDGVVDKHVIEYLPTLGKLTPAVVSDIDKLYEAYTLGIEASDAIVPTFKNVAEALEGGNDSISFKDTFKDIKTGDVFQVEGEDFIRIKTSDTESKQLNISKETYLKLFPPIERYATTQNQIGNCWELTGINSLLCEPDTRASVLELFSQDDNNIVIKFPNGQYAGTVFENGELPTTADKRYYSKGALGVQMLEYADGVEIQLDKINSAYKKMSEIIANETDDNRRNKFEEGLVNFTRYIEYYNGNVEIDLNNGIQWKQYEGKYDSVMSENRNGGYSSNLYNRLGYKEAQTISLYDENGLEKALSLLNDSKSFDDYIISFASGGEGMEKTINSPLGIVSHHAYRIKPATVDSNGGIKTFKLINPWGALETELTYEQVLNYGMALYIAKK